MLLGHAQMLVVAAGHAAVPSPSLALPSAPVLVLVLTREQRTNNARTAYEQRANSVRELVRTTRELRANYARTTRELRARTHPRTTRRARLSGGELLGS